MDTTVFLNPCLQILMAPESGLTIASKWFFGKVLQRIEKEMKIPNIPSLEDYLGPFKQVYDTYNLVAGKSTETTDPQLEDLAFLKDISEVKKLHYFYLFVSGFNQQNS